MPIASCVAGSTCKGCAIHPNSAWRKNQKRARGRVVKLKVGVRDVTRERNIFAPQAPPSRRDEINRLLRERDETERKLHALAKSEEPVDDAEFEDAADDDDDDGES